MLPPYIEPLPVWLAKTSREIKLNECPKLVSGKGGVNVYDWVVAADDSQAAHPNAHTTHGGARRGAGVDSGVLAVW